MRLNSAACSSNFLLASPMKVPKSCIASPACVIMKHAVTHCACHWAFIAVLEVLFVKPTMDMLKA